MRLPPPREGTFTEGGRQLPQPRSREATNSAPRQGRFTEPGYHPRPVGAADPGRVDIEAWRPGSGEIDPIPAGSFLVPDEDEDDLPPLDEEDE